MLSLSGPRRCHKVHFLLPCVHIIAGRNLHSGSRKSRLLRGHLPEMEGALAGTKDAPGERNG